jgi:hypothetical protein
VTNDISAGTLGDGGRRDAREAAVTRSLFSPEDDAGKKPIDVVETTMAVLITVKAAPNPSTSYGETVCVAGIRIDPGYERWVRLYPVSFRDLERTEQFRKYQVVHLRATPNQRDRRIESWRPNRESITPGVFLKPWASRRPYIDPYIQESMCAIHRAVNRHVVAPSLAAVRPKRVRNLIIKHHPGWSTTEQAKIENYVNQYDLTGRSRTALEAPRFRGWYSYVCWEPSCRGHQQGILDWEFVTFQRNSRRMNDEDLICALRHKFLTELCSSTRDVAFYVGNQAKREQTFSVLGVYYPHRLR